MYMKKILFIDTETTGLNPIKNSLWQLAAYYRNSKGELLTLNLKCKPLDMENISDEALQVCHTTKEALAALPETKELYTTFRDFLIQETRDGEKIIWAGYNYRFDQAFVESLFKHFDRKDSIWNFFDRHSVDMLDYMRLLRSMEVVNAPSLKLETAYKMFGVGTEAIHDALEDAKVAYMIYQWATSTITKGLNNDRK